MIGLALFAQLAVVAHAPDTATTCAPFELTVAARMPGVIAPAITPPASNGTFQLLRSTVVTRIEGGAGQPSAVSEATFVMATSSAGRVTLPAVMVSVGSHQTRAVAAPLEVRGGTSSAPLVIVRASLDPAEGSRGDTLFVGQQVDYVVDVQLNDAARQRLRRNPTFFPPEMPGVLAYDVAAPIAPVRSGQRCFATLSYRRALFPLFAGRTAIAPATLTYSLPLSTSFFSREESFELRTDSVHFVARDVPTAGRPGGFAGAVGSLSATPRWSATHARMGDPVVLTLRVAGSGNVKLWPRPVLALPWAATAPAGERVSVDSGTARIHGAKEFDWLVTPRQAGRLETPAMEYPFFDVSRGVFSAATIAPLTIGVTAAALATLDSSGPVRLPLRLTIGSESGAPLTTRGWFWLLLALAPLPAAGRRIASGRRGNRGLTARQELRAGASSGDMPPRRARRLFLRSLRDRVGSVAAQESPAALARSLRRAGVTEQVAVRAAALLEEMDVAAFGSRSTSSGSFAQRAESVLLAVDAEAVWERPTRSVKRGALVLVIAAVCSLAATAAPIPIETTFSEGINAYSAGNLGAAASAFARVLARAPRSENAWMNLGTTSWARADTASAVRAWQRALLLSPLDDDVRQNLAIVQTPAIRSMAFVPPVPSQPIGGAALMLWLAAWATLAVPRTRRAQWLGHGIAPAMIASIALLGIAVRIDRGLSPAGLAVMRHGRTVQQSPGSLDAAGNAAMGEIGRLGAREGSWVLLRLDGARTGWVPLAAVLPLDAPPSGD